MNRNISNTQKSDQVRITSTYFKIIFKDKIKYFEKHIQILESVFFINFECYRCSFYVPTR